MSDKPKIKLILTPVDQFLEVLAWIAYLFLWGFTIYTYNKSPQIVPIHFDAYGKANGFGSKSTLFLQPIIATFLFVGLTALNKIPHLFNYPTAITPENAVAQYSAATRMLRYIKLIILVIFNASVWLTVDVVTGKPSGLSQWFLPFSIGLLFITIAGYLYKSIKTNGRI